MTGIRLYTNVHILHLCERMCVFACVGAYVDAHDCVSMCVRACACFCVHVVCVSQINNLSTWKRLQKSITRTSKNEYIYSYVHIIFVNIKIDVLIFL